MIEFFYQTDFELSDQEDISNWIQSVITSYGFDLGSVSYIFCDDSYLLKLNQEFLNHDTFTDILSFDYTADKIIEGEIYISVERVRENSDNYGVEFLEELRRVIIHGILHFCGFSDESPEDRDKMRELEDRALAQFHQKFLKR